jgi:hypothetical protein
VLPDVLLQEFEPGLCIRFHNGQDGARPHLVFNVHFVGYEIHKRRLQITQGSQCGPLIVVDGEA